METNLTREMSLSTMSTMDIDVRPAELIQTDQITMMTLVITLVMLILMFILSLAVNIIIISIHFNNHSLRTISNR